MDSNLRTAAKSATWQLSGLIVMTMVGFLFTGSIASGGGLALTSTAIGTISFFIHEKAWGKVRWGKILPSPNAATS